MLKKDKRIFNIVRGILVFLFFLYSAYLQYIPVLLFRMDVTKITMKKQVMLSTFSSTLVALILIFVYRKDLIAEFKKFKDNFAKNIDIGFKYWTIGLIIMVVSNLIITFGLKLGGANNENQVQDLLHALPALMAVTACIIGPFNEEIVFRKTLKDVFKNKWVFCILSFVLFGAAHVVGSSTSFLDYLYIIPYGSLGFALALIYYESDTIFTSVSMHMIHNTALVLLSILSM